MSAHTSGSWRVTQWNGEVGPQFATQVERGDSGLAPILCGNPSDAALIAAAPDLLVLVDIVAERLEQGPNIIGGPDDARLIEDLHAALRKARGGR